jgi:hypothetical protein
MVVRSPSRLPSIAQARKTRKASMASKSRKTASLQTALRTLLKSAQFARSGVWSRCALQAAIQHLYWPRSPPLRWQQPQTWAFLNLFAFLPLQQDADVVLHSHELFSCWLSLLSRWLENSDQSYHDYLAAMLLMPADTFHLLSIHPTSACTLEH